MNKKTLKRWYLGGLISREEYMGEIRLLSKLQNKVIGRKLPKNTLTKA